MKEVHPGIFVIVEDGFRKNIPPPVNIYIIPGKNGLIFDAGYGRKKAVKKFLLEYSKIETIYKEKNIPFNVEKILPSHVHPDHFSGLKKLKKFLKLKVVMTKGMSDVITSKQNYRKRYRDYLNNQNQFSNRYFSYTTIKRFMKIFYIIFYRLFFGIEFTGEADEIIDDNGTLIINNKEWQILHSPGHCRYHISLYNKKSGILLGGDNVLNSITTWLGPPDSDLEDYENSLKMILSLPNLKIILTSHGRAITNPKKRINEILDWRKERAEQLLLIIKKNRNGITVKKILKELYSGSNSIKANLAQGWIQLELLHLMEENLVGRKTFLKKAFFFPLS